MDTLTRIICEDLNLRAYTVNSLNTVREIIKIHETSPNATYALGRSITATALLSATLKPDSHQNVTVRFSGNGPIREIHVQADARGNVRGYISNPLVDMEHEIGAINFSKAIGAALLTVTKDIGLKEPYSGVIPLQYGKVASDIAYYLTKSEQVPSALIIGQNVESDGTISSAGGILIQTFPDTKENVIIEVEERISSMKKNLGDCLKDGDDILLILTELFDHKALTLLEERRIHPSCRCSKELLFDVLKGISNSEIEDMIEKDNGAEIVCTFCRNAYNFSKNDLIFILNEKG